MARLRILWQDHFDAIAEGALAPVWEEARRD